MQKNMREYKLPRYTELPNVGLYLEQVVKYVNDKLSPLDVTVTPSMVSNYVKKGYISRPVKKQYYADHIAYVMFIVLAKQVISMESIAALFELQKSTYDLSVAYNYFCNELENMLQYIFEVNDKPQEVLVDAPFAKKTLRSLVIALSHIIYLNYHFTNRDI